MECDRNLRSGGALEIFYNRRRIKLALDRGLKAELTEHLGHDMGDPVG
ncbi:hypothetical protein [Rhodococcus sp. H29-C3]|nr:hypothetical protein [Rhodococcus sp. H29-C3]MDJ0363228.1 hypothetical protein [Rhodococcus sp. H29-C3]